MPSKKNTKNKIERQKLVRYLVIAAVLVAIVLLLAIKNKQPAPLQEASQVSTEVKQDALSVDEKPVELPAGTPEQQLEAYLENGKAVFIFFHSDNCQSCIDMMGVVDQVYPDYQNTVPLVDVNVYDPANQNLLKRAGINTIPTQLFLDANGQGRIAMGIMSPAQLQEQLNALAEQNQ